MKKLTNNKKSTKW